ncbi:hypothetical protein EYC80_009298 [Monilinia laxa]|uniref:BZIP domain-containing protein n=1 Tax=Monilinia laxa TaxID=61186 RepID=A0A5N6JXE9_MONLA|nr:hypothetical protein EYC80_009298 [Monilinia laxa]
MIELYLEWRIDYVNRRRSQNRIAQRKFRESRKKSKISHDHRKHPPSSGGCYSTIETDSIGAPDLQNSTVLGINPPNNFVETIISIEKPDSSATGSPNLAPNDDTSRIENISFVDSLISGDNISLSTPQITNFQSKFDQELEQF